MTDLTERLTDALRPVDAPTQPVEGWVITNLELAAWASRKAAEARGNIARVAAWGQREIARIQDIVLAETMRFEYDANFFEGHLADYLAREIAAGRKTKSRELPGGTIKLTARQPKIDVDAEAFLPWAAQSRPDLVRTKVEVDKATLKKVATLADDGVVVIDGEIVPGATWEAQGDSATFTPAVEVTS